MTPVTVSGVMTVEEVKATLAKIDIDDAECAHEDLDALYVNLLRAIAAGTVQDPPAVAQAALEGEKLAFPRWYS